MIVFFIPNLQGGGAERVMLNLALYFHEKKNFKVAILLGKKEGVFLKNVPTDILIYELGFKSGLLGIIPFILFCKKYKPKYVIASLGSSISASFAKPFIFNEITIISRLGNTIGTEMSLYRNKINKYLYLKINKMIAKYSDIMIFQCNYMYNDFVKNIRLKKLNYQIIYNPVDIKLIKKEAKNDVEKYDFIAVGRFQPQKDYASLIKSCIILKKSIPNFKLGIIGKGYLEKDIKKMVENHQLSKNITFLGYKDNPYPYIKTSKFLVSSSIYEGFSNVIIEALCLGIPVIATDCPGGNRETIKHGVNGYLCKTKDPTDIAEKLELGLKNIKAFKNKKSKIQHDAIIKYDISHIAKGYNKILNKSEKNSPK